jgi:formylglycine-generating enzyme
VAGNLARPGRGRLFPPASPRVSGSGLVSQTGSVPAAQAHPTVPGTRLAWLEVPGGTLPGSRWRPAVAVRDLAWAAAPVTVAAARSAGLPAGGDPGLPLTRLDWRAAQVLAAVLGGRLPSSAEWEWMAGRGRRRYPWGEDEPTTAHANLRALGLGRATPPGAFPAGSTPEGIMDVAGNVWEWTSTTVPGGGAVVRGGSYNSISLYATCVFTSEIPAATVSPGIGLRVVTPR